MDLDMMTNMDLDMMTNMDLIQHIKGNPSATPNELVLADRLEAALGEIDLLVQDIGALVRDS